MEYIRRIIRNAIGSKSVIYKFMASCLDFIYVVWLENLKTWQKLKGIERSTTSDTAPVPIKLTNLLYPLQVRPRTDDVSIVINNIIRKEYGKYQTGLNPTWMIDAGAYIGDTSSYFLSRYKYLNVIALEPNPDSFNLAEKNLEPYGNRVVLLKKALWKEDGSIIFGGQFTSAAVKETGNSVECISITSIMDQFSIPRLNILKMDIEGAEQEIFTSQIEKWIDLTDLIIIEIHGNDKLITISNVLKKHKFYMIQYRSIWYCKPIKKTT